jgi:hypothetical protein
MAAISTLITELRVDIEDGDSTRWTDAKLLSLFKKAIRRANRIVQRHDLNFGKKSATLTTTADQAYIDISSTVSDFDVFLGLYHDSLDYEVEVQNEHDFALLDDEGSITYCRLDQANSKIYLKGTPADSTTTLTLWYFPTVDPSAYTTASDTPWGGRLDDVLMEYVRIRALNIDEMTIDVDTQLMTDMENQILQSYRYNSAGRVEHNGWL